MILESIAVDHKFKEKIYLKKVIYVTAVVSSNFDSYRDALPSNLILDYF
jgi:hypothetical protein